MKIEITESASDDIADGHLFYEFQEEGLGYYFESTILTNIRSMDIYAGIHEIHFEKYYRMIATHFPYAIFYRVEADTVRVYAVLDTRRNPDTINDRLS